MADGQILQTMDALVTLLNTQYSDKFVASIQPRFIPYKDLKDFFPASAEGAIAAGVFPEDVETEPGTRENLMFNPVFQISLQRRVGNGTAAAAICRDMINLVEDVVKYLYANSVLRFDKVTFIPFLAKDMKEFGLYTGLINVQMTTLADPPAA